MLVARYGAEDGKLEVGGRSCSSWWREIVRIRDGVEGSGGGSFDKCVSQKVGDVADTAFWRDCWFGVVAFRDRFRRLYDLADNKVITV